MFRKVTALLVALVICCTSLGACSKKPEMMMDEFFEKYIDPSIPIEREYEGVRFLIEDVTTQGAYIRFENNNKVPVLYSSGFYLFINTDIGYRYIDLKKNVGFKDGLFEEPRYDYLDFTHWYKSNGLAHGSYRIYCVFVFPEGYEHRYPDNFVYLYVDFEISK